MWLDTSYTSQRLSCQATHPRFLIHVWVLRTDSSRNRSSESIPLNQNKWFTCIMHWFSFVNSLIQYFGDIQLKMNQELVNLYTAHDINFYTFFSVCILINMFVNFIPEVCVYMHIVIHFISLKFLTLKMFLYPSRCFALYILDYKSQQS